MLKIDHGRRRNILVPLDPSNLRASREIPSAHLVKTCSLPGFTFRETITATESSSIIR